MSRTISKEDLVIHERALKALRHFQEHGDNTFLTKLVMELPNSNRRAALITWCLEYSPARWIAKERKFRGKRQDGLFDFDAASRKPFWEHKIWRKPRRHVSGVTFDPELFLQRVSDELEENKNHVSPRQFRKLQALIEELLDEKISSNPVVNSDARKSKHW